MTNLPTNPTKNEITERYWFEFLQFIKHESDNERLRVGLVKDHDWEYAFWSWYVDFKLEHAPLEATRQEQEELNKL